MQAKINEYNNMKQKIGGEETEIGFVSDEWKRFRLGELVKYEKGRKPERLFEVHKVGYLPYLTAEYFRGGDAKQFVDVENERSIARVSSQDIVLIWDGSKAGDVFTGLNGVLASTMVKIEPSEHLIKPFLYYFLKTKFIDLNEKTTGSTIPHVSKTVFENLTILCPPLPDQQKIAKVLNTIQRAIEQQNKIIEAAKNLKRTLMQKLFTEGLRHTEFKETVIGQIPANWQAVQLGELVEVKGGKRLPKGHKFADAPTQYPYIRLVDFRNNSIVKNSLKFLTPQDYQLLRRYTISQDDIYISIAGTTGLVGIIPGDLNGAILTENAAKLVIKIKENLSKHFLMYFLASEDGQIQVQQQTAKALQPKLALSRIRQIVIPLPPLQEQQEIAHILSTVDKKREVEERKKVTLRQLFRTMLSKLMTGEIRLKDVEV